MKTGKFLSTLEGQFTRNSAECLEETHYEAR
jgi:hypothetical protein